MWAMWLLQQMLDVFYTVWKRFAKCLLFLMYFTKLHFSDFAIVVEMCGMLVIKLVFFMWNPSRSWAFSPSPVTQILLDPHLSLMTVKWNALSENRVNRMHWILRLLLMLQCCSLLDFRHLGANHYMTKCANAVEYLQLCRTSSFWLICYIC